MTTTYILTLVVTLVAGAVLGAKYKIHLVEIPLIGGWFK